MGLKKDCINRFKDFFSCFEDLITFVASNY